MLPFAAFDSRYKWKEEKETETESSTESNLHGWTYASIKFFCWHWGVHSPGSPTLNIIYNFRISTSACCICLVFAFWRFLEVLRIFLHRFYMEVIGFFFFFFYSTILCHLLEFRIRNCFFFTSWDSSFLGIICILVFISSQLICHFQNLFIEYQLPVNSLQEIITGAGHSSAVDWWALGKFVFYYWMRL